MEENLSMTYCEVKNENYGIEYKYDFFCQKKKKYRVCIEKGPEGLIPNLTLAILEKVIEGKEIFFIFTLYSSI